MNRLYSCIAVMHTKLAIKLTMAVTDKYMLAMVVHGLVAIP